MVRPIVDAPDPAMLRRILGVPSGVASTFGDFCALLQEFWATTGPRHPLCHALTRITRTAAIVEEARVRLECELALCKAERSA